MELRPSLWTQLTCSSDGEVNICDFLKILTTLYQTRKRMPELGQKIAKNLFWTLFLPNDVRVCMFFLLFSWKSFLSFLYLPSSKYLKHLARYVGDLFRLFSLDYDVWKTKVHLSLFLEKEGGVDTLSYVHTFSVFNSLSSRFWQKNKQTIKKCFEKQFI